MKKIISIVLAAALMLCTLFALASCGGAKYKVGVQTGTTGWSFMSGDADWEFTGFSNIDVASFDSGALAVSALKAGNVDFVVIDAEVAKSLVAENAGTKVIDIALTTEAYGIAVDKNQTELLAQINNVLSTKKAEVDAIFAKYANVADSTAANWTGDVIPAGTYDASKNQLVVATNAAFAPFEFTVGNGFAGIDMEIAKLVADTLGMELVIKDMEFDSITTSLGVNGIDVGIAGMTINPARQKVVNFTDSYYTEAYQVIIVRENDTTFDACTTTAEVLAKLNALTK